MTHPHSVGLVFAIVLGGWHLVWSILVATGWAQSLYDLLLWMHMIHLPVTVGPFNSHAAITLILATAAFGYVIGWSASWVWNRMHR